MAVDLRRTTAAERPRRKADEDISDTAMQKKYGGDGDIGPFKPLKDRRKKDRRKQGYERRAKKFDKDKADDNYGYGPLSGREIDEK